jgi:hypothetical protein
MLRGPPKTVPDVLTVHQRFFRASDPKVEGTFGLHPMLNPLSWRIVLSGKPEPLFRAMR